ncbi:hypothetical protein D9613_002212 [Agrocybe pediades]|uniref:HORMA domain-containing protein n=1 Tax=Agrocybe pediades TaxID=84607 RepID=A0A8H4R3U0_9AGAR|nr:hypothetical protein D9613_002212 [Agrocybe pediades]
MSEETLTFNQTVQAIAEFIEVAIHTILYVRQIYPAEVFVRRKKFDTPVYQSRHPALNEYISGAVKAVADELAHGKVDKVVVVIKDKEQTALERFIFSVETMINVEGFNKDIGVEEAMTPSSLVQYFRSFLVKLNMIETQIGQMYLGDDASFAVVIELKDDAAPTQSHTTKDPPPWMPAVTQHTTSGVTDEAELHMLSLAVQESGEKVAKQKLKEREERAERKRKKKAAESESNKDAPMQEEKTG